MHARGMQFERMSLRCRTLIECAFAKSFRHEEVGGASLGRDESAVLRVHAPWRIGRRAYWLARSYAPGLQLFLDLAFLRTAAGCSYRRFS